MGIEIHKNLMSINHTALKRSNSDIQYIVCHYVGALGDGKANTDYYKSTYVGASADFWVGHGGDVWQGNDYRSFYSWHCGGGYQSSWRSDGGGRLYGTCTNRNSVGIEICVKKKSTATMNADDADWYFTDATVEAAAQLVAQLMKELDIDIDHVVRHYDVNAKICPSPWVVPGSIGGGPDGWKAFKKLVASYYDGKDASSSGKETATPKTKKEAKSLALVEAAETIGKKVAAEIAEGKRWEYRNDWVPASTFDEAVKSGKRYVSCANGVIWAVKAAHVSDVDGWFGAGDGTICYPSDATRKAVEAAFTIVNGGGKTVGALVENGTVKAGSVVTLSSGYNHTFLYLGGSRWYDCGHAHCSAGGEGAPFTRFVSASTPYWNERVGKVLTPKGTVDVPVADSAIRWYRVGTAWKDGKCVGQLGAYEYLENAKKNCPAGCSVFDADGKIVYTVAEKKKSSASTKKTTGTQSADFASLTEKEAAAKILEMARAEGKRSGILPSLIAAQAILESGYCRVTELVRRANNCFGMKTNLSGNAWASHWDGTSKVTIRTPEEYTPGVITYITADFRKYPCLEDSFADHSDYLLGAMNGSKKRYAGLTDCEKYEDAIRLVKAGGYATDSKYVSKLCSLVERYGLDAYDADVKKSSHSSSKKEAAEKKPAAEQWYRVGEDWRHGSCVGQIGAYKSLANAKKTAKANPGYAVFDWTGKRLYRSKAAKKGTVTASILNVRRGPGLEYEIVGDLPIGATVTVLETKGGWLRIGTSRWVHGDYVTF